MPKWLRQLFGLPDPPPLWVPIYQPKDHLTVSEPDNHGGMQTQPLNQQYFVTIESAYYLAGLFGATVVAKNFEGAGGPVVSSAQEYFLHWADGLEINAGFLARYFKPADGPAPSAAIDNPDLPMIQCRALIDAGHLTQQGKK